MIVYEGIPSIILAISSLFIIGMFLCSSYKQNLERSTIFGMWKCSKWEYVNNKRIKYPLWLWIFSFIACIIPLLNIILVVSVLITYLAQLSKPDGMDGFNLVATRTIIKSNWFNWLKFLNKKI